MKKKSERNKKTQYIAINPLMPRNYSAVERKRLREWEKSIMANEKKEVE